MNKSIWPFVAVWLLAAVALSGCIGGVSLPGQTRTAEIRSGDYLRINSIHARPTPVATGVVALRIDRDTGRVIFDLADGSQVTTSLAMDVPPEWGNGCLTNLGATRMEILRFAEDTLTLDSATFSHPLLVANCPVPPTVIVLREAAGGLQDPLDAAACDWWAGARCIYFGQAYVTLHGQIVDADTGEPIPNASVVFATPAGSQVLSGTFQIVLPGGGQVEFAANAPGYTSSGGMLKVFGDRVVISRPAAPAAEGEIVEMLEVVDVGQPLEFRYRLEQAK